MKFNNGDRVRIIDDIKQRRHIGDPGLNASMEKLAGQEVTILSCKRGKYEAYKVEENPWLWDSEWLKLIEDAFPVEIKEEDVLGIFE